MLRTQSAPPAYAPCIYGGRDLRLLCFSRRWRTALEDCRCSPSSSGRAPSGVGVVLTATRGPRGPRLQGPLQRRHLAPSAAAGPSATKARARRPRGRRVARAGVSIAARWRPSPRPRQSHLPCEQCHENAVVFRETLGSICPSPWPAHARWSDHWTPRRRAKHASRLQTAPGAAAARPDRTDAGPPLRRVSAGGQRGLPNQEARCCHRTFPQHFLPPCAEPGRGAGLSAVPARRGAGALSPALSLAAPSTWPRRACSCTAITGEAIAADWEQAREVPVALADLESEPGAGAEVRRDCPPPRARRRRSFEGFAAAISRAGSSARASSKLRAEPGARAGIGARRVGGRLPGPDPARGPRGTRRGGRGAPAEVRAEAGRAGGKAPSRSADGGARVEARPPSGTSRSRSPLGADSARASLLGRKGERRDRDPPGPRHHRGTAARRQAHEGGAWTSRARGRSVEERLRQGCGTEHFERRAQGGDRGGRRAIRSPTRHASGTLAL